MTVPTTFPAKAVNTVIPKPADASQQTVPEKKQTQANNASLPTQTSNDKSVVSTSAATKSDLAAVLLPVKVVQPPASAQLDVTIENNQYQLNKTAELQKLLQQTAQVVIASDQAKLVARAATNASQAQIQTQVLNNQVNSTSALQTTPTSPAVPQSTHTLATQIILLAQPIQLALPPALEELAKQNGVSTQQLAALAARAQGYPLPTAVLAQGQLTFSSGTSIQLPSNISLNSGQYLAKVVVQNQQLQLSLTPVIAEVNVDLTKVVKMPQAVQSYSAESIVITKNEPAQILSQFLKKLEATSLPPTDNAAKVSDIQQKNVSTSTASVVTSTQDSNATKVTSATINPSAKLGGLDSNPTVLNNASTKQTGQATPPSEANLSKTTTTVSGLDNSATKDVLGKVNKDPAPIEVLNKALSKAGAMPIKQQLAQQTPHNLATELFKHLPQMSPHPLSALSDPALLSSELYSLAALNLAQTQLGHSTNLQPSALFSGSAITTLFQLLLGVKTKSTGSGISDKLQAHLAQLQQRTLSKLSANSGLFAALDKLGGADSLAQLASSISLYQHASTDPNQAMTWYFALPYSINQRDEQFEGKFEQEQDQDNNKKTGWKLQLKFNLAQGSLLICAHKHAEVLDIQFKGNNQMLLSKVGRFNQALTDKITQIGFTPGKLTTQLAQIPATLLPGDHYLVKTRA
ncbi:flagellar hook-length control protein FliK [Shewanella sp. MEBiC00475]|uniref:flagellar hook-length control protein FliK n=1 Tax=Shewanella sp. MEBiC00475 TaxID=2575361 RepID=UPI0010BFD8E1|nr:flagellar hook-length control protein FliK [Shewanella sp. MEBiC00475]